MPTTGVYKTTARTLVDGEEGTLTLTSDGKLRTAAAGTGTSADEVQGTAASGATDAGKPVKIGAVYNTTQPTLTNGQRGDAQVDNRANIKVTLGGSAYQNASEGEGQVVYLHALGDPSFPGKLGVLNSVWDGAGTVLQRGNSTGTYTVAKPFTSGGLSPTRVLTGTTGVIKASAGQLYKLHSVRNANAAVRYLHLYDKATAPTLSTDTPVLTISLLASSVQNEIDIGGDIGVAFANGISWSYTTDNIAIPATAATSTELMFSGAYK